MSKSNKDNRDVFFSLFMRYQRDLYNVILAMCPNYTQADDILQETATLMWQKFEELKDHEAFFAWGVQIARFKLSNHRRKKTAGLWLNEEVLNRIIDETEKCIEDSSGRIAALQNCLLKLPENERRLIALRYEEGKSFSEISKLCNHTIGSLYNISAKIHQKLFMCISLTLKKWGEC